MTSEESNGRIKVRRALLSVSDKTGIVPFAKALHELGIEILSSGGTYKLLTKEGVPAKEIADYTGFPEMMDGRVKTLHPKIHGGILARRDNAEDMAAMEKHDILPIDMVVVNLYPFREVTADPDCDLATAIENIDIGGPALLRAAAKNYHSTVVVDNPEDYDWIAKELATDGGKIKESTRFDLAADAFQYSADYDHDISSHLLRKQEEQTPSTRNTNTSRLRYGENPHQKASFSRHTKSHEASIAKAQQLQGKELSYNNILDADTALECVKSFRAPACVIVKHANPCGVAEAETLQQSYNAAFQTDPTSAYGGIIAFNRPLDAATVKDVIDKQFAEVIVAPKIDEAALSITGTKQNMRVLECGKLSAKRQPGLHMQSVCNGVLIQDRDVRVLNSRDLKTVSERAPTDEEMRDMLFAWPVVKYVKSNAIVYCRGRRTLGIGAGQMSRVYSAKIAAMKAADAGHDLQGAVMASDAFFPFRDGIDAAAEAGISAVIQPGGSKRDAEVIAAADEAGMAMLFTGIRHFRH